MKGCGISTAHALASYGFGDSLLQASRRYHDNPDALTLFLSGWRDEIKVTLRTDPRGLIGRRLPKLAAGISDSFPSYAVLKAYTHPLTSWSDGQRGQPMMPIRLTQLDLRGLANLCRDKFGWGVVYIGDTFKANLWEGAFSRMLSEVSEPLITL